MNHLPTKISEKDFELYIAPFLTKAKRGFVSSIPLYLIFNGILYKLYSGCQWKSLPVNEYKDVQSGISLTYHAFYHHFRKWSNDESLLYVFKASMIAITLHLNLSEINLDGTLIPLLKKVVKKWLINEESELRLPIYFQL